VHVHGDFDPATLKFSHKLSICHHTYRKDPSERIKRRDLSGPFNHLHTKHLRCISSDTRKALTHYDLPVHLLCVCRQIYHETTLKPFSETTFTLLESKELCTRAFLEALVPTQIRAIKHLQLASRGIECPASFVMRRLSGVECLDIEVGGCFSNRWGGPAANGRLHWLNIFIRKLNTCVSKLDLKQLSVTLVINERVYTKAEEQALIEFMDRTEEVLRQSVTPTSTPG
jgi:hypothetical protein